MTSTQSNGRSGTTDVAEFGHELRFYLTGKGAVVEYGFDHRSVAVPTTTGPDAGWATWKLDGTIRIRTTDRDIPGSVGHAGPGARPAAPGDHPGAGEAVGGRPRPQVAYHVAQSLDHADVADRDALAASALAAAAAAGAGIIVGHSGISWRRPVSSSTTCPS